MTGRQAHIIPIKASWFVHNATRARADCQSAVVWATDMKRRIVIETVLIKLEGMVLKCLEESLHDTDSEDDGEVDLLLETRL